MFLTLNLKLLEQFGSDLLAIIIFKNLNLYLCKSLNWFHDLAPF